MSSATTLVVIGLAVTIFAITVALVRRGNARTATLGGRRLEVRTAAAPATVRAALRALGGPYRTDDEDADRGVVVLSSRPTLATWGFFYPIFVHADGTGSRLEIGIKSRFIQVGPLVTVAHQRCVAAIEAALAHLPFTLSAARP